MSPRRLRGPPRPPARSRLVALAVIVFPIAGACAPIAALVDSASPLRARESERSPEPAATLDPPLPPLQSPSPWVDLLVPGRGAAVVSLPLGATTPRPVVVAAHGAGDRPEWQCQAWRRIVGDRAFVLCPRGHSMDPRAPADEVGYFYTTHLDLGREITAALAALAARYPSHADTVAPVYAGFSQGAIMGALLLPRHPAGFARAVLIEGGYGGFQEWNLRAARLFREHGGQAVLLACGRLQCAEQARTSAGYMQREGLEARVLHAPGAGHTYGGEVQDQVAGAFEWMVSGDHRFQAPPGAAALRRP